MALTLCGINHETADAASRAALAVPASQLPSTLQSLSELPGVHQAVIVSTCHRTEYIVDTDGVDALQAWLGEQHDGMDRLWSHFYLKQDEDAVRHLVALGVGLDSMVLGEPEILGQLKQAYTTADDMGVVGPTFRALFQGIFSASKKIRSQTAVGQHSLSMAHIAWQWAAQLFGDLQDGSVLFVGAGMMNAQVAAYASAFGVKRMWVASRRLATASVLAESIGGTAIEMVNMAEILPQVDMVVSATNHPLPVIGKGMIESSLRKRRGRPMLLIDLAVPPDIEPEVRDLSHVYHHTMEDMEKVLAANQCSRERQAQAAHALVAPMANQIIMRLNVLRASQVIQSYRKQVRRFAEDRVAWAHARLRRGDDPMLVTSQLADQLTQQMMHRPTRGLRQMAERGQWQSLDQLWDALAEE